MSQPVGKQTAQLQAFETDHRWKTSVHFRQCTTDDFPFRFIVIFSDGFFTVRIRIIPTLFSRFRIGTGPFPQIPGIIAFPVALNLSTDIVTLQAEKLIFQCSQVHTEFPVYSSVSDNINGHFQLYSLIFQACTGIHQTVFVTGNHRNRLIQ